MNVPSHSGSPPDLCEHDIYKRAESMIPQLDGTYNVSDSSDTDSHGYLDLASTNIIQYRTEGRNRDTKQMKWHMLIGTQHI